MDTAKYIVITEWGGMFGTVDLVPIIFPAYIPHTEMMVRMGITRQNIDSAGFVAKSPHGGVQCYGRSDSLDIGSKGIRDNVIMDRLFRGR